MLAGMSGVPYDPEHIARFYDEYGGREWERFDIGAMDVVGLEVHLRLLGEHIRDGDRVVNDLLGGLTPVPERAGFPFGLFRATTIHAGGTLTTAALAPGIQRFECLIHPWMRTTVEVG